MLRFSLKTLLVFGLCVLAGAALAAPRTLYPLLSDTRRPPLFALPDARGQTVRLDTFLHRKRIVVLALPAGAALQGAEFLRAAQTHRAEFEARDLVVLALVPPQSPASRPYDALPIYMLQDANAKIAHVWGGSRDTPAFYLIGKDGGIKLASRTFPALRELFATIDAMPMRREEMRR